MCRRMMPMALSALFVILIPGLAPAANLGVQIKLDPQGMGVLIQEVVYKSPAEMAGLKPNDVIAKIDGTMVTNLPEFVRIIREHKAGEKVMLDILRDGKEQKISVTLGN